MSKKLENLICRNIIDSYKINENFLLLNLFRFFSQTLLHLLPLCSVRTENFSGFSSFHFDENHLFTSYFLMSNRVLYTAIALNTYKIIESISVTLLLYIHLNLKNKINFLCSLYVYNISLLQQ